MIPLWRLLILAAALTVRYCISFSLLLFLILCVGVNGLGTSLVGRLEELLGCVNLVEPVSAFSVSLAISTCASLETVDSNKRNNRAVFLLIAVDSSSRLQK